MAVKLTTRDSFTKFAEALRNRKPFRTSGALHSFEGTGGTYGRLNPLWRTNVNAATYAVYSYGTPIAWFLPVSTGIPAEVPKTYHAEYNSSGELLGWWVMPDEKYSVTTTRHQGKIRTALSQL